MAGEPWLDYAKAEAKAPAPAAVSEGPWSEYQTPANDAGPWSEYQKPKPVEGAPLEGGPRAEEIVVKRDFWNPSGPEAGGAWGLDPENEKFFTDIGLRNTLQGEQIYQALNLGARALDVGQDIGHKALVGLDELSIASGLADALSSDNGANRFLPGTAIGALLEALPEGGLSHGIGGPTSVAARATSSEIKGMLQGKLEAGATRAEMDAALQEATGNPELTFGGDLDAAIAYRDDPANKGKPPPLLYEKDVQTEAALKAEADAFRPKPEPTPESAFYDEAGAEAKLAKEAEAFKARPKEDVTPVEATETKSEVPPETVKAIVDNVNEAVKDWKKPPRFEVHESFDDLDVDNGALGVYDSETGGIRLNAKAIQEEAEARGLSPEEMTNTVVFHEGLGHFGLAQQFQTRLDDIMTGFYRGNVEFKDLVDKWRETNPDAYADDLNPLARASEEVLAEMSEGGKIPTKLLSVIKNYIKSTARKMGIELDYSLREIKTILSQVHDGVIGGADKPVGTGNRYMMRRYGKESKGPLQSSATINKVRSSENIEEILSETAPEKIKESWDEWIDEAGKIRTTGTAASSLAKGAEVPELLAAEKYAAESANRIKALSRKAAQGLTTERENYLLGREIERLTNVSKSIGDVVSNAGRILNSRKIEVSSDKALSDNILRMMSRVDFNDPVAVAKAAKLAEKMGKRAETYTKVLKAIGNALNLPRSLVASMDLSAPFNQGAFLLGRKELWKNIPDMFRQAWSPSFARAVEDSIKESPTYPLMEKAGLEISNLGADLTKREEQFMSQWAEKIPVAGRVVKASERAYTGFLNKVRADTFNKLVKAYEKAGVDIANETALLKGIASYVNNATGRGELGKFSQAAPILNGLLFSPRLMASRVKLLNLFYYGRMDSVVRKEALTSLGLFGGIATTAAVLAKMAGADVEANPRSSDFGKIKVGNTRYNLTGGFSQYLTLAARLATNETKNVKGEVKELGKEYGSNTRLDVLEKFGENKFSPVASFIADYLRGQNAIGEPFDVTTTDLTKNSVASRFIPLFMQDATELIKEEGAKGIPMSLPGLFGISMQTYEVKLGYDAFGRDIKEVLAKDAPEDDPAVLEAQRLAEVNGKSFIPEAPKSVREGGKKTALTDEQHDQFQKTMGEYTRLGISQALETEEYTTASDEEKIDIVKEIHKEAYGYAKEEVLAQ